MSSRQDSDKRVLDEAARAGWLYYVAELTQDQIAAEMGISRQRAQRLVSRALAENLIHVRLEHRLAKCFALELQMKERFGLKICRVAPGLGGGRDPTLSVAPFAAAVVEQFLSSQDPLVIALGTGRTLRATVEELTAMECPHHKIVSLTGNISPDGSASSYDVVMRIADKVNAPHYPMPLPVAAASPEQLEVLHSMAPVQRTIELAKTASVTFVGVGQMNDNAPMLQDGFISRVGLSEMQGAGAVGEIVGWAYDAAGAYLGVGSNRRVTAVRVDPPTDSLVVAVAAGREKILPLQAAISGRICNGLITCEDTAKALLI